MPESGPFGPSEAAVHWLSASFEIDLVEVGVAELRHLVFGDADHHRPLADAHDRDRRVRDRASRRATMSTCTPGVARSRPDAASPRLRNDARGDPHQADDDAEREDQAREQHERRRGRPSGCAHRLRGDDLGDADAELFVDDDDFAAPR